MPKPDLSSCLHHPRNGLPTIAGRPPAACQSLIARGHEPDRGGAEGRRSRTTAVREHPATPLFAPHHDFATVSPRVFRGAAENWLGDTVRSLDPMAISLTHLPRGRARLHSVDGLGRAGYGAGIPRTLRPRPNVGGNATGASDMPMGWCRAKPRSYCVPRYILVRKNCGLSNECARKTYVRRGIASACPPIASPTEIVGQPSGTCAPGAQWQDPRA